MGTTRLPQVLFWAVKNSNELRSAPKGVEIRRNPKSLFTRYLCISTKLIIRPKLISISGKSDVGKAWAWTLPRGLSSRAFTVHPCIPTH